MLRPRETSDCFNIFVMHQNRSPYSEHGYISQSKLPDFLNLVIWGHEHECRITPEHIPETTYYISQPGIKYFAQIIIQKIIYKNCIY